MCLVFCEATSMPPLRPTTGQDNWLILPSKYVKDMRDRRLRRRGGCVRLPALSSSNSLSIIGGGPARSSFWGQSHDLSAQCACKFMQCCPIPDPLQPPCHPVVKASPVDARRLGLSVTGLSGLRMNVVDVGDARSKPEKQNGLVGWWSTPVSKRYRTEFCSGEA